jgi:hypothetical protein
MHRNCITRYHAFFSLLSGHIPALIDVSSPSTGKIFESGPFSAGFCQVETSVHGITDSAREVSPITQAKIRAYVVPLLINIT